MRKLRIKLIIGAVLFIVLCFLFYHIQFAGNAAVAVRQSLEQRRMSVSDIEEELVKQSEHQGEVETMVSEAIVRNVQLRGDAIKALEETEDANGIRELIDMPNQARITVTPEGIQGTENVPAGFKITPANFTEDAGWFLTEQMGEKSYIVYYCNMHDGTYSLEWEELRESFLFSFVTKEEVDSVRAIEEAHGIHILQFILPNSNNLDVSASYYIPREFSGYQTLKDFGITPEMVQSATKTRLGQFAGSDSTDDSDLLERSSTLTVNGVQYECYFRTMEGETILNVLMLPSDKPIARSAERTALLLIIFVIAGCAFLVWAGSIYVLVIRHALNDAQKKYFKPSYVFRRASVFILCGTLVVAVGSVFLQCLFASFNASTTTQKTLATLGSRMDANRSMAEEYQRVRMKTFESSVEAACLRLFSETETIDSHLLEEICARVDADYMVVYDETGTQVASNTGYTGLTLGDGGEGMMEFRRLLKGVTPISKAEVTDAQTMETKSVFGGSLLREGDGGKTVYWAVLMFVDPTLVLSRYLLSENELMTTLSSADTMCFGVNPETGRIVSSSRPEFIDRTTASLGLPQEALKDSYMGFFRMDNVRVYGMSMEKDGVLYYSIIDQDHVYRYVPENTFRAVLAFLGLMSILAVYLFTGYRKVFARYGDSGKTLNEVTNLVRMPSGLLKTSVDPVSRWSYLTAGYGSRTPIHNAVVAGQAAYMVCMFIAFLYTRFGNVSQDNSVIAYIVNGKWSRGFNLFAFANILFLFIAISVITICIRFIVRTATLYTSTKGETIGRLLLDFIGYLSVIVFAYFALSCIGVDTGALIASLGLMSFALTLGAQDLIRDILAGLSIVIDGVYQVGDIVEVNGFWGTILEIGVRTIKIEGRGGNILIMGNRDIRNVINKTRKNSWVVLDVGIADTEDLPAIRKMLEENLPRIGGKIPGVISGPYYKGITNIGNGRRSLSIIAECREVDVHHIQRDLTGAIASLFKENGIAIK
ncbi:MAG: mechanosensitive ion channel [Clostridia bacterium]|nr:mechanosensitive ion channel [Clostridia bacterium]